jgi:hypothetical protein
MGNTTKNLIASAVLALVAASGGGTVFAGATLWKMGTEPDFWDGVIIIYAVAEEYKFETVGINNTIFTFRPLATLTGTLDPVKERTIKARGHCDGLGGADVTSRFRAT